jgi:hypothetical protein
MHPNPNIFRLDSDTTKTLGFFRIRIRNTAFDPMMTPIQNKKHLKLSTQEKHTAKYRVTSLFFHKNAKINTIKAKKVQIQTVRLSTFSTCHK